MKRKDLEIGRDRNGKFTNLWWGNHLMCSLSKHSGDLLQGRIFPNMINYWIIIETMRLYLYFRKDPDLFRLEMGEDVFMFFYKVHNADIFGLVRNSWDEPAKSFSELLRRAYFSCIRP